ncbi:MAG TPA: hypothetical protein VIU12_07160 [Chryseolinea sp.]
MRKGLGLTTEAAPQPIGNALEAFWGTWNAQEARQFDASVEDAFGSVDERRLEVKLLLDTRTPRSRNTHPNQ